MTDGLRRSNDREPGAVPEEETPDTGESNPVMRILDSLLPSPPPQNQKFLDPNHQGPSQMESEAKETLEAPAPERALPTAAEGADRPVGFSPEPAAALEEQVPEEEAPLAPVRQWGWLPWRRRGDDPSPWRGTGGEEESGAVNPSAPPQEAAEGAEGVDAATKETHAHPPIPADPAGEDVPPSPRNSRWQEILTPNYLKMWSGFFFLNLHFTIFNLLPYYLELRGAAPWLYGSISGVFGFSSMAALLILGRYVDRFSRKTTVGVSMIFAALGNLLAIWAMWQPGLYWYFLVRLLQGVFLGVGFPLIYGWLVELSQLRHRHIVVAWFGIGGIVANALGPSLGELTLSLHREPGNPYSYGSVFGLSLIFLGLSLLFFLMAKDRYPTREQQQFRGGVLPLLRSHPVALLATVTLVFGGIYGVLMAFSKNYTAHLGLPYVSVLLWSFSIGALLSRIFVQTITRWVMHSHLVLLGFAGMGLMFLFLAVGGGYGTMSALGLLYGVSHGVLYPALYVRFLDLHPAAQIGRANLAFQGAFSLGTGMVTLIGGSIIGLAGFSFFFSLVGMSAGVCILIYLRAERQAVLSRGGMPAGVDSEDLPEA